MYKMYWKTTSFSFRFFFFLFMSTCSRKYLHICASITHIATTNVCMRCSQFLFKRIWRKFDLLYASLWCILLLFLLLCVSRSLWPGTLPAAGWRRWRRCSLRFGLKVCAAATGVSFLSLSLWRDRAGMIGWWRRRVWSTYSRCKKELRIIRTHSNDLWTR